MAKPGANQRGGIHKGGEVGAWWRFFVTLKRLRATAKDG